MSTVTDLGTLGGPNSAAAAINTQSVIVGSSETSSGTSAAVIWPQGIAPPVALPVLSNTGNSVATALTNSATPQVVGAAETGNGNSVAVLWTPNPNGSYTISSLGTLGGNNSVALGINNASSPQIVGTSEVPGGITTAFVWQNGIMTALPPLAANLNTAALKINLQGQIVGLAETASGATHAVTWQSTAGVYTIQDLGTLPGGKNSSASDINNGGANSASIVGTSENATGASQAFIIQGGTSSALTALVAGLNSSASAVVLASSTLYVVGSVELNTGAVHAVVWESNSSGQIGSAIDLGTLPNGLNSTASDIASVGGTPVAVGSSETSTGASHAVVFANF
ncbi:TPA: HAF repeat-containing protein [Bacillus thuringiensis]|nr:HAF repeat-containing protein [Bacillus thuringiensis]